ncbi:LuxR family transcriptional regulator, partial [Streptomyces sp. NPDC046928]
MTTDRSSTRTAPPERGRTREEGAGSVVVDRGRLELARGRRQLSDGPVDDARESLLLAASLLAADAPELAEAARMSAAEAAWAAGDIAACLGALDGEDAADAPSGPGWARDAFLQDHRDGMRALLARRPEHAVGPLRRVVEGGGTDD